MLLTAEKIDFVATPSSEGMMYAIWGKTKGVRAALKLQFGSPMPAGHWLLDEAQWKRLVRSSQLEAEGRTKQ